MTLGFACVHLRLLAMLPALLIFAPMHRTLFSLLALASLAHAAPVPLSDGKTFDGWEGDIAGTWRIEAGAFVGGSLAEKVPHNEFLCTKKEYGDFELRLKFKLTGTEGMINGGVQFRSQRIPNHFEVSGYQADLGDGFWGALYDESRRKKVLVMPDKEAALKALKRDEWNDYVIRCEGPHIQIWLNGLKTVDFTEPEEGIARKGILGVQIHGGGKAQAFYKDMVIEELPAKP